MADQLQITLSVLKVLREMFDRPLAEHYGLELMKGAGLKSGTLYPILSRLEKAGWIEGEWQDGADLGGRPPRKYYKMTTDGMSLARQALAEANQAIEPKRVGSPARPAAGLA
jgi:PadR family transcriptional regulator, regulatory protein PadR